MKIYWKYTDKDYFSIWERDTKRNLERCIFDTTGRWDKDWSNIDYNTIEEEMNDPVDWDSITEISKDDAFLEMI